MATHRLHAEMLVDRPIDEVFAFFARPENLGRVTPRSLGFELRSADLEMREGLEVDYRVRPLLGIPLGWRSRITEYDPPHAFRDVQVKGPYRTWEHRHAFMADGDRTRVTDDIVYSLPFGPLGGIAHAAVVRQQLEEIFRHRARTTRSVFAEPRENDHPLTVAVAGGSGFVGGGIAAELHARGQRVVVLSRQGATALGPLPDSVEVRHADVARSDGLPEALAGVDALVIALAFNNSPMESPSQGRTFMEVDAAGTERLVAAAQQADVRQILYLSGAGAAPDAARHWFRAKWRAEEAVRGSGVAWTIIRPTWIYGPRDVSLNRFIGFARQFQAVPMTNFGGQLLAPLFIDDVGRLVADCLEDPAAVDQVFEVGGPETMSMRDVIARALRAAGIRRPIIPGPTALIRLGAAPLKLLPSPPLTPDAVDFINQPATVDVGPLLRRMPRRLTPLDEGLATYLGRTNGPDLLTIDGLASADT
jgi:nucleoside-diphosphate-sugar epimerase/ligand-binding SRPBCC domain-containing protein